MGGRRILIQCAFVTKPLMSDVLRGGMRLRGLARSGRGARDGRASPRKARISRRPRRAGDDVPRALGDVSIRGVPAGGSRAPKSAAA